MSEPYRDERDATIERLREELQDAKDASTKLARLATKKTEPKLPLAARWWVLPLGIVGAVLGPPAALLGAVALAAGLHALFVKLFDGEGTGGPWISAILLTCICVGLTVVGVSMLIAVRQDARVRAGIHRN